MGKRGFQGPLARSTHPVLPGDRGPKAPRGMSPREKAIWAGIVENMKPGWYHAAFHELLKKFCTTAAVAEVLSAHLKTLDFGCRDYLAVAREHREATRTIISLSVKLRLCPSANRLSIRSELAEPSPAIKPWLVSSNDGPDAA